MLAPETKDGIADPSVYSFPVSQHVLSDKVSAESMQLQSKRGYLQHVIMISFNLASTSSEDQLYL